MKRYPAAALTLILALALATCGAQAVGGASEPGSVPEPLPKADVSQAEEPDHSHQSAEGDNILPHEPMIYCGNTITEVTENGRLVDDPKAASFWGGDSVALTDLLIHLDYSEGICRCLPEYLVETEFGEEPYGVNLSESYARYGDSQVELTQEQVEQIQGILDRNLPD